MSKHKHVEEGRILLTYPIVIVEYDVGKSKYEEKGLVKIA